MEQIDPAEKEQKSIINAIHEKDNEEILKKLFLHIREASTYLFMDEVRESIISHNEKNIRDIIRIIKESGMDSNWNNDSIFSDEFKTICGIPILLPATFMGFLSGEFIIYMLHKEKLVLYFPDKSAHERRKEETDSDYNKKIREDVYLKKYKRFYSGANSYIKQLQEAFTIDLSSLCVPDEDGDIKRKGTNLWKLFETYSYMQNGKLFDGNDRVIILRAFSKNYVDIFPLQIDGDLNTNQKYILLLKTFLFQELDENERASESWLSCQKFYMDSLNKIIKDIRHVILSLAFYSKASIFKDINPFKNDLKYMMAELKKCCSKCKKTIDEIRIKKCKITEDNLYTQILSIIILYEILKDLEVKENTFSVIGKKDTSLKDTMFYLDLYKPLLKILNDWEKFYAQQYYLFSQLLGEHDKKYYKKIWLMAIKILMYCYPERLGFDRENEIPKSPSEKWFKENNICIEEIKLTELYSTMSLINESKKIMVKVEGKNSKKYSMLASRACDTTTKSSQEKTLFSILDNIRNHDSPELREQIRYMIVKRNDEWIADKECIDCIHEMFSVILYVYHRIIEIGPSCADATQCIITIVKYWDNVACDLYKWLRVPYQSHLTGKINA